MNLCSAASAEWFASTQNGEGSKTKFSAAAAVRSAGLRSDRLRTKIDVERACA
jgi:hypothetical protein